MLIPNEKDDIWNRGALFFALVIEPGGRPIHFSVDEKAFDALIATLTLKKLAGEDK